MVAQISQVLPSQCSLGGTQYRQASSVEEIVSSSWDRKVAEEVVAELAAFSGERHLIEEMRRFLAIKAYRGLFERLQFARQHKVGFEALRSVAHAMREYALERPALAACAFRAPTTDCPEWNDAASCLAELMLEILGECGVQGRTANVALCTLWSLVRGFVLHQVANSFRTTYPYGVAFDGAMDIFIAGISTLARLDLSHAR